MDARKQSASPGPGGSNLSPSTYQVNVSRKKTRKWVEAKVQNYDGDDWGAPESDEEDDSPVAALPPVPRPVGGQRLPSESRVAGGGRSASGQLPVSVPTAQPPVEESVPAVTRPSNLGGLPEASDDVVLPQSGLPTSGQTEPVLLPASTYEQQAQPGNLESVQNVDSAGDLEGVPNRLSTSPQLPNVSRMSGFGVDFFSAGPDPTNNREPTVQEEREPSPLPAAKAPFSVPEVKEPEPMATESTLPSTTFTPPPVQSPIVEPEKTESHDAFQAAQSVPRRPSLPGQYVTEDPTHEVEMAPTPLSPPAHTNEPEVSPVSEHAPRGPAGSSTGVSDADAQRLQPGADAKSLPPLRTPSPHEPRTVPPAEEFVAPTAKGSGSSEEARPEITPTEPLQPKPSNYTPSDYASEGMPLSRQFTVDTVASSPVKESDMLSEEIMRTLTPGGLTSPTDNPDDKRKSQAFPTGRESSYTLSGYDDYWADTTDKRKSTIPGGLDDVPEVPPVPIVAPTEAKASEPTPVSPEPVTSPTSEGQASLRRRFSWEGPDESQAAAAAATVAAAAAAAAAPLPPVPATESAKPEQTEKGRPASPVSPTINVVSDAPSISHQISQASSKPATQPTPEPPSPVSELSDRDATPLAQPVVSPDDGGGLPMASPLSSNPVSTSHGDAQPLQVASPTPMSPGKSIMTFREIMDIPTSKDRIAKYEETQQAFASQDSGLDNWLTTMRSEYPEHAQANGSFSGAPVSAPPSSAGGAPAAGPQPPPTDQPYYQQYLQANANAPSASNSGSARSRIAGYTSHAQTAAGSAFGDGGKQIGTKGKEFMHTAGKMGKGLFSKGKSKLQQAREAREARGEKGDTSPPPPVDQKPQRPERPDRRMSWALSLGQKSRENGPAPPEATAGYGHERSLSGLSTEPPRLAEPARLSPLLKNPSPTTGGHGAFWQDTSANSRDAGPEASTRTGNTDGPGSQASQAQRNEPPPNEDADWVMVPRQSADQHDTVATDQNAHHHPQQQLKAPAAVVPEDSGIGMASQSADTRPDAQRHSSFRGLPPIRRNSSFGLSAFDATREAGRVSPVEDDDVPTHNSTSASAIPQQQNANGTFSPHDNATNQSMGVDSNATLIGQDSTARTGRSSMSLSKEPMRFYQPQQQEQQQQQPLQVDTQLQNEQQQGQPGDPNAINPIQRTPPTGWQLEESHLAAPLHVARRRAGTDSSQQQVSYGFDKETGGDMMSPTSPIDGRAGPAPTALSPQTSRQRTSDVPPSSARRYPDLFRPANQGPQQRGRANSGGQPMVGYQQYQPRASQEGQPPIDKAQEAGYGASQEHQEEQGKRKASDIFRGIGGRFKKTNSEERRNSVNSTGFERTDTMNSMNSTGQTSQKKKRTSFIPEALRPRPSMDVVPPQQIHDPNRPVTQQSAPGPDRSGTPQSEKKRSLLGGRFSAAQTKFLPGGLPGSQRGSSTSNLANDTNSVGGADSVNSMGPPKKRFSGFTDKAATFAGRFRQSDDYKQDVNMPQDPASMSQSSLPPPPPPKTRGRSASAASAGSHGMAPPPAPGADAEERRGRRGSFQGMMSNIMGRSSSKTREAEAQQPLPIPQGQFIHYHPGTPTQQQYGGQGPYPPMQGQMSPPVQHPHQPPPQAEQARGPSMDAGQRASRHLSGQFMQPPRPSPLAQESSAAGPQSQAQDNRVVSPPPPSNHSEHTTSSKVARSEGRVSPMPFAIARKPTKSGPHPSVAMGHQHHESVSSATHSTATEQPTQSITSEPHTETLPIEEPSRSSTPRNEPPSSPVKRLPTPHATALFSSMLASEEPQRPISSALEEQSQIQSPQSPPQDIGRAGPSGHVRTESATSSRAAQSATGLAPSREATPVQSAGPQGPASVGRSSGSLQGSPAQSRQPDGRFSPPQPAQNPQFQNPQQGSPAQARQPDGRFSPPQPSQNPQFPLQFMQHRPRGPPQNVQQGLPQQGHRPGPPQGPQPGEPQGQQFPPQGYQQGFNQQQGPRPQGPPQGPPGPQQGFQQNVLPQGFSQNGPPQAQPQGQESKLKGWKNRMSTQMANMKAQSQTPDRPQQAGQQVQQGQQFPQKQPLHQGQQSPQSQPLLQGQQFPQGQQVHQGQQLHQGQQSPHSQQVQQGQQGQQPTKGSWKDRLANMAPSNQVKTEQPQQQGQAQQQRENWKDRFANMAPSAQVKTQLPQAQGQQPVQPQVMDRPNGSAPGAHAPQPQPGQPIQTSQPQTAQAMQNPELPQGAQGQAQFQPQTQLQAPEAQRQAQGPQASHAPQAQIQPQTIQAPQTPQTTPQKSSWRSRMSGQLSSITPQTSQEKQDKPEKGDKPSAGDKLFGALKRVSKPADQPPPPPPKNGQPQQQPSQWRPSPVQQVPFGAPPPQQVQNRPHPFTPHDAYGQYAQQAQTRPPQNMPPGQFPQHPPQQQPQQWQGQQHPGRPVGPQQQWSHGQQMISHHQQPNMRPPEPQYDQVPIPKGYGQVQGEYQAASRMSQGHPMHQGQMHPQQMQQYYQGQYPPQQQQQMQQQAYYQGGQMSPPPQQQQQGQQVVAGRESPASPPEQGGFNLPIQGNITPGNPNPPQLPVQDNQLQPSDTQQAQQQQYDMQQQAQQQQEYALQRPPAVRGDTIISESGRSIESGVMGGMGSRVLPPGHPQYGHHLQTQPSTTSMNGPDLSGTANQISVTAAVAETQPTDVSRSISVTPEVIAEEPKGNNLAIDVDKSKEDVDDNNIYDATPRLKQEATGGSHGVSDQSSTNDNKQPTPETKKVEPPPAKETEASPPMELEDTADARMRTLRIGSQEEKIFYDPEGDVPKMSATSYPGQEWNPYGEPEFGDWKEDEPAGR